MQSIQAVIANIRTIRAIGISGEARQAVSVTAVPAGYPSGPVVLVRKGSHAVVTHVIWFLIALDGLKKHFLTFCFLCLVSRLVSRWLVT